MKLLATGAAGFIGANFVHYTMRNHPEFEVVVLDALTYAGNRESLKPVEDQIEFVHGDICDAELVNRLVKDASDYDLQVTDVTINGTTATARAG